MEKRGEANFHTWSIRDAEHQFKTDRVFGLSKSEIIKNRQKYGANTIIQKNQNTALKIFFRQFANFFILLLLVATIISYYIDGLEQSIILLAVILVNVLLGFFQEYKADRALAALKRSYLSECRVVRGKITIVMPSEDLVVGDVVVLEQGDKVPADIRISESVSLRIDESMMTGESMPISKTVSSLNTKTALSDRSNMVFASTLVVAGHGRGIVVGVGGNTEFGKIAGLVNKAEEKTPLEKQIDYIAKNLTLVSVVLCVIVFGLGYWRGESLWPLLTLTIALLVAAVPESLPTAVTLALSIGVSRMAKQKAIVRRLASVETLGTVNVIATDKTGTITKNHLTVDAISLYRGDKFEYLQMADHKLDRPVNQFITYGLLCSNVDLANQDDFTGDPLETAIAELGKKLGHNKELVLSHERISETPFDSKTKFMSVLVKEESLKYIVKGAPEVIIDFCNLTTKNKEIARKEAESLSKKGYKVIAIAVKYLGRGQSPEPERMDLLGFFCMADEPAEGVEKAIKDTLVAGIWPVIITGDHPETARFIARKIGLEVADDEIMVGVDFSQKSESDLAKTLKKIKIFARILPEDKYKIVQLYQKAGFCVAMTGDGVNDAPAIKQAEVGIAMGVRGSEVAKDSADIVLLDDKYSTIITAIEYGRTIYDNIKNTIVFLIAGNLKELMLVGLSFAIGLPTPLITVQILWINLVTDSLPALALAVGKPDKNVLSSSPRPSNTDSLRRSTLYSIVLATVAFVFGLAVYLWAIKNSLHSQSVLFAFIVIIEMLFALSIRSRKRIWQSVGSFFGNRYLVAAIVFTLGLQAMAFLTPVSHYLGITLLNRTEILVVVAFSILTFFSAEIVRAVFDRSERRVK
ncbi:MAG: cation-transporting P-type ATPase [Candidatus Berkelbacteria bacterium]